jgi:hypothetical protein
MKKKRILGKKMTKRTKRSLIIAAFIFALATLIITISWESIATSAKPIHAAGSETQFKFDIAYAYVGPSPHNSTYIADNGAKMSIVSQYPSTVQFNITRLPGDHFPSCDAALEFYSLQIKTDHGIKENIPYFIGTNYNASFSDSELSTLFAHADDLVNPKDFSTGLSGDFKFNMTDNSSIISVPVGSAGVFSTDSPQPGLSTAGNPHAISVTVQRIGYIIISNDSVSLYKDQPGKDAAASVQLSNHDNGFLHNNIVPANKLPQTDLFHPNQTKP